MHQAFKFARGYLASQLRSNPCKIPNPSRCFSLLQHVLPTKQDISINQTIDSSKLASLYSNYSHGLRSYSASSIFLMSRSETGDRGTFNAFQTYSNNGITIDSDDDAEDDDAETVIRNSLPSRDESLMLTALGAANKSTLPGEGKVNEIVIPLEGGALRIGTSPNVLYERSFYEDLLSEIRKSEHGDKLIGNEGTSTGGMFHYWLIYRYMQAIHDGT